MADKSGIEWTDASWNPIRARSIETGKVGWYCAHKSPGCIGCYAEDFNTRLGTGVDFKPQLRDQVEIFLDWKMLTQPTRWTRPRLIFPCSMTDLFGEFVTDEMIDRLFDIMEATPRHTYQIVTKRPERMALYIARRRHEALRNVWLGCSVEDQRRADERKPAMAAIADFGWATWVSYEPALGPVDWSGWEFLKWLVSGGQSGRWAAPSHPAWHRAARDYCAAHGIAYFFKQWGEWAPYDRGRFDVRSLAVPSATDLPMQRFGKKAAGRLLDGRTHDDMPARLAA